MAYSAFHGVLLVQHKPLPVRDSWPHKWHSHLHWKRFAPATNAHLDLLCGCLTCMPIALSWLKLCKVLKR